MQTPVLLMIFNRPHYTAKTIASIRKAKPSKLYISADGPRVGIDGEKELCEQVRKLALDSVDWECEIKTRFIFTFTPFLTIASKSLLTAIKAPPTASE